MTRDSYLFRRTSIFDVLEGQKRAVKKAVEDLEAEYLLSTSEHDLIAALVGNGGGWKPRRLAQVHGGHGWTAGRVRALLVLPKTVVKCGKHGAP